ncbi:MAG: DNA polymerase III subunit psi [Woeseiaceae bacterium]
MNINLRQFTILNEMGIQLWQRRTLSSSQNVINKNGIQSVATNNQPNELTLSIDTLTRQQLFKDVMLSLNLPLTAVKSQNNALDLGFFTWQFIEGNRIVLYQNCLTTPDLITISHSSQLKRLLWKILQDIQK